MRIHVDNFAGLRPAQSADKLAPGEATVATNVRLSSGDLEPLLGLLTPGAGVTFTGTPLTIYRFGQASASEVLYWFQSTVDADFVKGPVDNDTEERTYWTDGVYPKKTNAALGTSASPYPSNSYRMGIPAPAAAPSVAVTGVATNAADPAETVVLCYTYVSAWSEEGPPSPVSTAVSWRPGQTLAITGMSVAPGGSYSISGKRLYRSATGSASTKFQLVTISGDIAIATTTYNDTALTANLGDVLVTSGWVAPDDTMIGLTAMANGVMAGFFGNTLCFSEPYAPYAWPVRYRRSTKAPIVGICPFDQSIVVATTQGIYVVTGSDPANMTQDLLPQSQSCVSKRSMVAMMGGVIFASPDGLWMVSGAGMRQLTGPLFDHILWQAYKPSSITAFESDNNYIAFYDTGAATGGLIFSFGESPTFSKTDIFATAGFRDKQRDALYLSVGGLLKRWDYGTALTYDWTSGVFHLPSEVNMGAAQIDAAAYPVTFKVYADGVLKHTETVANKYPFRLPGGYRSIRYSFNLTGTSLVREATMATTVRELGSV